MAWRKRVGPLTLMLGTAAFSLFLIAFVAYSGTKQAGGRPTAGKNEIEGIVTSVNGPEAGVWVIAETNDLATKFAKIVVTDDQGRYLIPDLPAATYKVWVRGYGLVDSKSESAVPGKTINFNASVAPTPVTAAQYYPSNYWYSLLKMPAKSEFPGTGPDGNGISKSMRSQAQWIDQLKTTGCEACHQLGDKATREIPAAYKNLGSSAASWDRRIRSGQDGPQMARFAAPFGRDKALQFFADWTDRIANGEYPKEAPPRPKGIERNVVITEWDWAEPEYYIHDAISTDKRNPNVNAKGEIYGPNEVSSDNVSVLNPSKFATSELHLPLRDPNTPFASSQELIEPWTYWGNEIIWRGRSSPHSSVMDAQGRIWTASAFRQPSNPDFCKKGSAVPSAKLFPLDRSGRQVSIFDPKTNKVIFVDTCFSTQHLQFASDSNNTLWFSSGFTGDVVGWLNTKMYEATHDEQKSQGWTAFILDTNGNGKRDDYVEPNQPIDPSKDKRITGAFYGVIPDPIDGSIWGSDIGYPDRFPGALIRVSPGPNPPETALTEIYQPPWDGDSGHQQGFTPRGIDIDSNGVIWTNLSGSGHLASFDRRKCTGPLNGPKATGQQCPEGWKLYPLPGPHFAGITDEWGSANGSYFNWVDQFNTLGLGKNIPIAIGNGSDSLEALVPATGEFVTLRVPYPMGFYAKGLDGRIDDPSAGWKGRAVWSSYDERAPWHIEGGKGTRSKVVKFQIRPSPLAN